MKSTGLKLILAANVVLSGIAVAWSTVQPQGSPANSQLTSQQQKQLDRLKQKQLDEQLQKDRDAVRDAVDRYGWDSERTDAAQEQLIRDRAEYRQRCRSLEAAGVTLPPPSGSGGAAGSRNRYATGPRGHGHHGCCWDDDDCCCHGRYDDHCCDRKGK